MYIARANAGAWVWKRFPELFEYANFLWLSRAARNGSTYVLYPPTPWTTHSLPTFLSPLLITLRVACRVATKGWRKRRSPWLFGIYSTPLKTSMKNGNTTSWRCISYAKWWFSIVMLVFGGVPHCPRFTQWWIKWWLANCKVYPTLVNIVHFIRINYSDSKPPPTQRPAYPLSFIMILLMVQKSQTTTWDV